MNSIRQQLLESFPSTEQVEVDRITRKLVTDDDDPLMWVVLQMRKSQEASSNLSDSTIARFEKSIAVQLTAEFREARQILAQLRGPQILMRLLLSKLLTAAICIAASAATVFIVLWFWSNQFEGVQTGLSNIRSTVTSIQNESMIARNKIIILKRDSEALKDNQNAIYEAQKKLFKDINTMDSIIEAAEQDKKSAHHP